jgi:hypothetical protein
MEQTLHPVVMAIVEDVVWQNIIDEVSVSTEHDLQFDIEKWKEAILEEDSMHSDLSLFRKVRVSADMGWQKRGSGFDSLSGHAFMFGAGTGRPLIWNSMSKHCRICSNAKELGEKEGNVPEHVCAVNHVGSASSMKPLAVVDMVHKLNDKFKCNLTCIVTDDDSKMKSNCRWSNADHCQHHGCYSMVPDKDGKERKRKCAGRLNCPIPEPAWLSEPNHRAKPQQREM